MKASKAVPTNKDKLVLCIQELGDGVNNYFLGTHHAGTTFLDVNEIDDENLREVDYWHPLNEFHY